MAAPRKYPEELKDRATRLAMDARADASTRRGAIARVSQQLDVHPEVSATLVFDRRNSLIFERCRHVLGADLK